MPHIVCLLNLFASLCAPSGALFRSINGRKLCIWTYFKIFCNMADTGNKLNNAKDHGNLLLYLSPCKKNYVHKTDLHF